MEPDARIELFWLPLGAGGHSVRLNGLVFDTLCARLEHRRRYGLYHSALSIHLPDGNYVIEMTPIRTVDNPDRVPVAGGSVGSRLLGRSRVFRYEVIRWREGVIPDVAEAVDSPRVVATDTETARRLLGLVGRVPTPVWGRDELGAGEMWNSNSVVSWLLTMSGVDAESIKPPAGGRAPGWRAGLVVAQNARSTASAPREQAARRDPPLPEALAPARLRSMQRIPSSPPLATRVQQACRDAELQPVRFTTCAPPLLTKLAASGGRSARSIPSV